MLELEVGISGFEGCVSFLGFPPRKPSCIAVAAESAKDGNIHENLTSAIPVAFSGPAVRSPRLPTLSVLLTC